MTIPEHGQAVKIEGKVISLIFISSLTKYGSGMYSIGLKFCCTLLSIFLYSLKVTTNFYYVTSFVIKN